MLIYISIKPDNNFFGGNIMMGDLLTVEDYVECIEETIVKKKIKPDLVIIPTSAFNYWKMDLCGISAFDIERRTGIKVEFINCERL